MSLNKSRIDGIDILRGISILFVLMNHVHIRLWLSKIPYTDGMPGQLVSSLVWNGQKGVQIFFCISGFLIASTAIQRWGTLGEMKARDFYLLRVARIAPLFLILLIILCGLHFTGIKYFTVSEKTGGLGEALFAALTFRINVLEGNLGYLPPSWDILWSLSVEEVFYLFFPLICLLLGRSRMLFGVLALFILLGPFGRTLFAKGDAVWAEYSYLGSFDAISFGVLTALLASRYRFSSITLRWLGGVGISLIVFTLGFTKITKHWGLNQIGVNMTILALGTCFIIIAAAQSQWKAPRLFYPILKLGERSYEIYLTHMFVILAFFELFLKFGKPVFAVPILFVASILMSLLLGELTGRFFSEPLNMLIRNLGKRKNQYSSVILQVSDS